MTRLPKAVLGAGVAALLATQAMAQAPVWPNGPVTIIVPYGTGGGADSTARALAATLAEDLGVPVTVTNVTGAGGSVGMMSFIENGKPDGQTLVVGFSALVTTVPMLNDVTYTQGDFLYMARLANADEILLASKSYPPNNPAEFIEYSKANPDALTMVYGAIGSTGWMAVQQLQAELGFEVPAVPLASAGGMDQVSMIAGDHAKAGTISLTAATPFIEGDLVKPIGILSPQRSPLLPDVPTFAEAGFDVAISAEIIMYGLAGTPPEVVDAIDGAVAKAFENPAFLDTLNNLRLVANYGDSDELMRVIAERTETANEILAKR